MGPGVDGQLYPGYQGFSGLDLIAQCVEQSCAVVRAEPEQTHRVGEGGPVVMPTITGGSRAGTASDVLDRPAVLADGGPEGEGMSPCRICSSHERHHD